MKLTRILKVTKMETANNKLDRFDYEYIYFNRIKTKKMILRKTSIWSCMSKRGRDLLGIVKWYGPWRQYCFFPTDPTVFSAGCMADIIDFIKKADDERRGK